MALGLRANQARRAGIFRIEEIVATLLDEAAAY
jgi:hypothetical protein